MSLFADVAGGYNEKRLLHKLLDHYNVLERPVANESDPLQLSFGLTLMQIIDVVCTYATTTLYTFKRVCISGCLANIYVFKTCSRMKKISCSLRISG